MRRLMWFTIGFGLACGVGIWCAPGLLAPVLGAASLLGCVFCFLFWKKVSILRQAAVLLLGVSLGFAWFTLFDGIWLKPAREADNTVRDISLLVTEDPEKTDYGCRIPGTIQLEGRTYKVLLYLSDPREEFSPGQVLNLTVRLRLTTDGGSREPTFHRTNGIFLLAYATGNPSVSQGDLGWRAIPLALRRWVRQAVRDSFPEDTQGFVMALLTGDTSGLTYGQRISLSLAGVSHVAAVSGMHMSILFGIILVLTLKKQWASALLGVPLLYLFAAMAGFSPSAVRAATMLSLTVIAGVLKKDYDSYTALSFSVLVLLIQNPIAAASVGLLMSAGSVVGILLFTKPLLAWLKTKGKGKAWKAISFQLAVTAGASVFTVPMTACVFGTVSLIAPISNLLILWAVTILFSGALGVSLLWLIWKPLAMGLGWVLGWLVRYVLGIVKLLARFPLAAIYPESSPYYLGFLLFFLLLLGIFLLGKCQGKRYFAFFLVCSLLLCISLSWMEGSRDHFRVTVLDVGQGQCILLQAEGRTFVVDCGSTQGENAGETAAQALQAMGIFSVDGLILTHFDSDHVSGARHLLSRVPVETIFLPRAGSEEWLDCGTPLYPVDEDLIIKAGEMNLQIFAPLSRTTSNESGLSVLFTWEKYDTLITGDMNESMERRLLDLKDLPDIELLVAGHHGSKYSTSAFLLERLHPEIIAVSVGNNTAGHPSAEMLLRAEAAGALVYRTDLVGTITCRG